MATIVNFTLSEPHPSAVMFTLQGELDESNIAKLQEALEQYLPAETAEKGSTSAVEKPKKAIFFFVKGLTYVNSLVIGYFARLHTRLVDNGQEMAFISMNPSLFDILDLVGMTTIINTYDTVEEAIAEMDL